MLRKKQYEYIYPSPTQGTSVLYIVKKYEGTEALFFYEPLITL